MKLLYVFTALSGLSAAPAEGIAIQRAPEPPIHLVCGGGGVDRRQAPSSAYAVGGGGSVSVVGSREVSEGYADQVNVQLDGPTGKVRIPRSLLPPIRGGADEQGYWRLRDIRYTATEITGRVKFNFLYGASVRIDRTTGHIQISGREGNFSGTCEPYDPAQVQRRF